MIQEFVDRFMGAKPQLEALFRQKHPEAYIDIVRAVVGVIADEGAWESPSAERIHEIDDGDYQGTLVFVIAAGGYQPDAYWYVKVGYGSCSACDTLASIREYSDEPPTEQQAADYMTLALHVVQGLRRMADNVEVEIEP